MSSIAWLENDVFLMVYTPNIAEDDMGQNPPSSYYIITRRKQAPFLVQKLPEMCSPLGGFKRTPAFQFISRLRDYKPNLKDVLIVSSTASTDVGIITRADQPLGSDDSAKEAVGKFTTTEVNDDTKKASLPLTESFEETSAIGLGIDLSSTQNVSSPIKGEALAESSTPLPNVFLLNNNGILSTWWFIYAESIRQKVAYHGLASVSPAQPQTQPQPQPQQPAFGQPALGAPAAMGAPAFGKPSAPAFGAPSPLGGNQGPKFGTPSMGAPAFGTPSQPGPTFGAPSALGRPTPQFGQSGFSSMGATSGFGQPSAPGQGVGSLGFGAASSASGGGFGSFAKAGGFSGFATAKPGESPFTKPAVENPFGKPAKPFGSTDTDTSFAPPADAQKGLGTGGFVLGSTFKGDGTAATDGPKPEKPSSFSFGATNLDDMLTSPKKPSTPMGAGDDMEPEPIAQPEKPPVTEQAPSLLGPKTEAPAPSAPIPTPFGQPQPEKTPAAEAPKPGFSLFGNVTTNVEKQTTGPFSPPSEKTTVASTTPKQEPIDEPPLPPDPTSKAVYGPGDTSASSNVSKASAEDAPLPPDFTAPPKPVSKETKPSPDLPKEPAPESPKVVQEEAPLPPDPTAHKEAAPAEVPAPVPESDAEEFEKENVEEAEEGDAGESDEADADESGREPDDDESDFADSGEEITHDVTEESQKVSPETSFGGLSGRRTSGSLFDRISKPEPKQEPRQLFGEITKSKPDAPGPLREEAKESRHHPSTSSQGNTLAAVKASGIARKPQRPSRRGISPEQARMHLQAQRREEEEELALSDDDEDERLRADLALPLEPVPTLDPFLPHQDYMGETSKPGVPGQIEKLYRDINSMIDTLGVNVRSLASYLLYQQSSTDSTYEKWMEKLQGSNPASVLEEDLRLLQIDNFDNALATLDRSLEEHRVSGLAEKLESCRDLLCKDVLTLRGQCASIRKTVDSHTDAVAIRSAPLSAEQVNLQQDLRTFSTENQAKLVDLEQKVSMLRAKIAEIPHPEGANGSQKSWKRPTMEQVASTITTMMSMAENKSSDIDALEVQLRRMGVSISSTGAGAPLQAQREGSPFTTPKKSTMRPPATPGSRGSLDRPLTAYHTPESARAVNLRSSVTESARANRFRGVGVSDIGDMVTKDDTERWKAKAQRRKELVKGLKTAIGEKKGKVRGVNEA